MYVRLDHKRVRVAGSTAEDMMTPIIRYIYPIEIPASSFKLDQCLSAEVAIGGIENENLRFAHRSRRC